MNPIYAFLMATYPKEIFGSGGSFMVGIGEANAYSVSQGHPGDSNMTNLVAYAVSSGHRGSSNLSEIIVYSVTRN